MMILAHNWDRPSFALDFSFSLGPSGPENIELMFVHRGLGRAAHEIVWHSGVLHVLDSDGGKLLLRGAIEGEFQIGQSGDRPFPRGLSVTRDYVLIGYGSWSQEGFARADTPTRLLVLRRATLEPLIDTEIGMFGNSSDLLVTSEMDFSDLPDD
jgi:hypothetical protein